jgi:hypothetical protein
LSNSKVIIIEGAKDTNNGDLREGFNKLFSQDLQGTMPRIIMGEGKTQAINKFRNLAGATLFCDLDSTNEEDIEKDLAIYNLLDRKTAVFYMIAEMEALFISQPNVLDEFYGEKISLKIPKKHAKQFSNPDEYLQGLTKHTKKGTYHKVRHGVELLKRLNAVQLKKDFPEYASLIECLRNKK